MIEKSMKRVLSALLAFCMVLGMWNPGLTVHAEETNTPATKVYDFESETLGAMPEGFSAFAEDCGTITVAEDPVDSNNQVLKLSHGKNQKALSAVLSYGAQTGSMSLQFRVRYESNAAQYGIYLLDGTDNVNMGPYLLATATGMLQYFDGGTKVDIKEYSANTWYTIKFVADVSTKTYDVYIDGEKVVTGAQFRTGTFNDLDTIFIACQGKYNNTLYIDDIEVPAPATTPEPEPEPEVDNAAPVWADGAVKTANVTAESAELSFVPAVDANTASKYQIQVNDAVAATVDFTELEEKVFTLPGATVNTEGQGEVYLIKPKNIPEGVKLPVVLGLHGNNGYATVFRDHTGVYGKIKDVALQNGYIFAAISNGTDIWGQNNDAGVDNVKLLLDYLVENYNTQDKAALWAYSAGGVLANRMVMKYPNSVSFVVGTYPVYNVMELYTRFDACKNAWGENAETAISAINPAEHTDLLKNHKFYLTHGDADETCPLEPHSQAMKNALGSNVTLEIVPGGKHNSKDERFHSATALSAFAQNPPTVVYALSGLTAETEYAVSVRATDAKGNYATSNKATFTTTAAQTGGEEEPAGLPYDFESEAVGSTPSYVVTENVVENSNTITVETDPADAQNQVLYMNDAEANGQGKALKANVSIGAQTGKVDISFRIKAGDTTNDYIINLMGLKGEEQKQAARFLLRAGKLQRHNGSAFVAVEEYTADTWYTVKFAMDIENSQYDLYIDGESIATKVPFVTSGLNDVNHIQFTTSAGYAGEKLYIDDIAVTVPGTFGEGGGEEPVDPPVNPDPDEPEIPAAPAVAFDFQNDTLNGNPKYLTLSGENSSNNISVVVDSANATNKVLLLKDTVAAAEGSPALKAYAPFENQTGTFVTEFKVRFATEGDDYIINLIQDDDAAANQGPRILAREGSLRYIDGKGNFVVFKEDYDVNAWYTIKIVSDISKNSYDLYVDGKSVVKGAKFASTTITKLNFIEFTTTGKWYGEMYIDDIAVPNPIKIEPVVSPIDTYIPEYMHEQLLADGSASTYLAFPSILKLSDEKVLIVYKATTAHMNVEAECDVIVYNPTTKQVVSKTTIDATVGEAAQNPELMQMPNGDLVIYLDVQRVTSSDPQQRYGIKELRSTDGGATWKVLAADGTFKSVDQVAKHGYKVLKDDKGIVYGYTFDDAIIGNDVYMLAMSFPEFAADPGRSVHLIKSSDNGATWKHVKNLNVEFDLSFNESSLEAYGEGLIINCRPDTNKTPSTYYVDLNGNVITAYKYEGYTDLIKTTNRPKLFAENGKYYLLGRNILSGATTLCLYEIDPVTMAPLNYIELKNLPGHSTGNSFYAEYYLQTGADGNTYFNVITYDDTRHKGHPDIVRYEYAWEELLKQTPVVPNWADNAVSVKNVADKTADVVFKAASDDEFVTKYTIKLNGETAGTINFGEIEEKTFTLSGVKGKSDGQAYIAMPKNIPDGMKLPVVIAIHGSSRGALDYKNTAFYAEQKNIALANGYIFAAISNDSDTWGLDDGLYNINLFYDYLIANYPVQEKAALWATSAGGTLANRMVKDHPEKVSFVLGTFPVYDLISGFNHVNSCKTAWGTTDLATFKGLIAGKNPAEFPDALKNHDYYIAHGSADVAVPIAENSQKMVTDVGSNVHLEVIEGGVHGTSNYAFYGDVIEQAFEEHPAIYTYALTGLTASTDYTVSITASDADGYADVSNTVSFKTLAEGQQPTDPDEPDQPEDPQITYITYDFEGEKPLKDVDLVDTTENSPITVEADPANANNHVVKIIKAPESVDGTANKVHIDFEKQEETVEVSYKLRVGANTRFVINLYGAETLGPRILLEPDGRVRIKNGGSWVNKATYTTDTWYTIKVVANVETDKYDVYLNGQQIATGMAFENALESINLLSFATFGGYTAEVYVDDVCVPEPPAIQYYTPEYMVSEVLFDGNDELANTLGKYTPFPTILKLSEEKVIIVYKRGTSHMDCEADMEAIVYNPTTEQVVSRTMLDATVGEAAQNPEIMQMPNGDLMIYLDVQRITGSGRQRYGVKQFRSTDQGETWKVLAADGTYKNVEDVPKHGFKILEDNTGIQYGYTFDDVIVGNDVYMLAMTFAEFNNDKAAPGRSVHVIKSSDNGATWTHIKNLNEEFGFAFNESTLEPCGEGFMVVTRGDSGAKFRTYMVDTLFNKVKEQTYEAYADILVQCGRPKLFVEDGKYYLLTRNKDTSYIMALYELDPETLAPVSYISLDQFSGDSCYAESFFHVKHGQKFLNVINYGDRSGDGKPDILRTEYVWEELTTQQAVEVVAHTFDCKVETAAYLKKAATCTEGGEYYLSCSCGVLNEEETFTTAALGHDWSNNDGLCARCGLLKIERVNMRFGSDLSLLFAIRQSNIGDLNGVSAKITKEVVGSNAVVATVPSIQWTTATINSVKYYVVEFDGLAAKEMSDAVTVEIMDATGKTLNAAFTTSIRDYAMEILGKTEKASYKTAIVDMLNYGTAAQEYFDDYNINEPANKLLSASQRELASAEGTYEDKRVKDDTYFNASNLRFVSKINLIFRLKISKDTYAVFTWKDHLGNSKRVRVENTKYTTSDGMYVVELDELVVADARQLVTCTIYNSADDSVVTTVVDSVESNVARRTETVAKLYVKFMQFADSAHAYLQDN